MRHETISVTAFKARCLELFDRLSAGLLQEIEVTRRGKVVAVVTAPPADEAEARLVHGSMAGMARVAAGVNLVEPALDDLLDAAEDL